jgi:lipopolysaccharide transport system permease protein
MMAATFGMGLILAAVNVRFRDVGYIVPFAIQTFLFLTPVVYPSSLLSEAWRPVAGLNPMVGVLDGVRWCLFGIPPSWPAIAVSLFITFAVLLAGLAWFARAERGFADII